MQKAGQPGKVAAPRSTDAVGSCPWRVSGVRGVRGVRAMAVSEMLGHSGVSITLDIYSHVMPGLGDAAATAMEDALGDDPGVGGAGGERGPSDPWPIALVTALRGSQGGSCVTTSRPHSSCAASIRRSCSRFSVTRRSRGRWTPTRTLWRVLVAMPWEDWMKRSFRLRAVYG